jgi:hypothetical protein
MTNPVLPRAQTATAAYSQSSTSTTTANKWIAFACRGMPLKIGLFAILFGFALGTVPQLAFAQEVKQVAVKDVAGKYESFFAKYVKEAKKDFPELREGIKSPRGCFQFILVKQPESDAPDKEQTARIFVFEDKTPLSQFEIRGTKNIVANWVSDELLSIEIWPGKIICLTQIVNVGTGHSVLKSAVSYPLRDERMTNSSEYLFKTTAETGNVSQKSDNQQDTGAFGKEKCASQNNEQSRTCFSKMNVFLFLLFYGLGVAIASVLVARRFFTSFKPLPR